MKAEGVKDWPTEYAEDTEEYNKTPRDEAGRDVRGDVVKS
jgi:hypothetical protein